MTDSRYKLINEAKGILESLDNKDLRDFIKKYKPKERIEIMPDLLVDRNQLYTYDKGKYIIDKQYGIEFDHVLVMNKTTFLIAGEDIFSINDLDNPIYVADDDIRAIDRLDDEYIIYVDNAKNLALLKYIDKNRLEFVGNIMWKYVLDAPPSYISIAQNRYLLLGLRVFKILIDKLELQQVSITIKYDGIISIGRNNNSLVQYYDTKEMFLYNLQTHNFKKITYIFISLPINIISDSYISMGRYIYKYTGDNLILLEDTSISSNISQILSNDLYYIAYYSAHKEMKIYKTFDLFKTTQLVQTIVGINIEAIPLPVKNKLIDKYKKLIPLVSNNIANIIIQFCRSDSVY